LGRSYYFICTNTKYQPEDFGSSVAIDPEYIVVGRTLQMVVVQEKLTFSSKIKAETVFGHRLN